MKIKSPQLVGMRYTASKRKEKNQKMRVFFFSYTILTVGSWILSRRLNHGNTSFQCSRNWLILRRSASFPHSFLEHNSQESKMRNIRKLLQLTPLILLRNTVVTCQFPNIYSMWQFRQQNSLVIFEIIRILSKQIVTLLQAKMHRQTSNDNRKLSDKR